MAVTTDDRLAVLPGQGRDPDVVLWNRSALPAEVVSHLRIRLGSRLVNQEDEGFSDESRQQTLEMDAEARAQQSIAILTNDDDGQVMPILLAQYLAKSSLAGQKGRDSVGVEDHRHSSGLT
jgi:hypothetical protein